MIDLSRSSDGDIFSIIPPGVIMPNSTGAVPVGWLVCDGSELDRESYPELFDAIGTSWGIGDGSTTFNLPDLRGRFMRGSVQDMLPIDAAQRDPDYASRTATNGGNSGGTVGSLQDDAIVNITGQFGTKQAESYATGAFADIGSAPGITNSSGTGSGSSTLYEFDASTQVPTGGDNRPTNVAVGYMIRTGPQKEQQFTPIITTTETDPTANSPIPIEIDLLEDVLEFDSTDILTTNCTIEDFVEVSSNIYTANLIPIASGAVSITIPEDTVRNFRNITNKETTFDITYGTAVVPVISTTEPDPTTASPIPFTVDFGEDVNGFTLGDIVVTNGTASSLVGGLQTYTFDVTPTAAGTVTVTIPASSVTSVANGSPNVEAQYNIEYSAPAVVTVVLSTTEPDPTSNNPIPFTVTFSEPVSGFTLSSISKIPVGLTLNNLSGTGAVYTFDAVPTAGTNIQLQVNAAAGQSIANPGTYSQQSNLVSIDYIPPVLDTVFMTNAVNPAKFNGAIRDIAIQSDGKILVGGEFTNYDLVTHGAGIDKLVRLNADGTTDLTFVNNAVRIGTTPKISGNVYTVTTITHSSDEKVMIGGQLSYGGGIDYMVRFDSDGTLDNFFVDTAIRSGITPHFTNGPIHDIKVTASNDIIVAGGFSSYKTQTGYNCLVKLTSGGADYFTFRDNAVKNGATPRFNNTIKTVDEQSDGKLVIGGDFTHYNGTAHVNYLTRVSSTGVIDTAFENNAVTTGLSPKFGATITKVKTQFVGGQIKILVGGNFGNYINTGTDYLTRLNNDGTVDTVFNDVAVKDGTTAKFSQSVLSMEEQADGKILFGGNFSNYDSANQGNGITGLVRVDAAGAIDLTFADNVVRTGTVSKGIGITNAVLEQTDGKILVGGIIVNYEQVGNNNLLRLL